MKWFTFVFLYCFLTISCTKDFPDCYDPKKSGCVNFNPCLLISKANADFTISEVHEIVTPKPEKVDTLIEVDTAYRHDFIEFTPVQESYDSLNWIVGAETLRTTQAIWKQLLQLPPIQPKHFWNFKKC
ncbi:MAG: hypothetical protein RI562_09275 [Salibacter sp.]|uniref:hypothetical protein n=1 Tax=Salibacter sp. TaxID=2010995 RepID=UPI0028709273|nr:hypothetical protein [Salibacter sp.]MDR9399242.1 hypothetical protein [Salibacter sp.]